MGKKGYVFPGQGAQFVGMGEQLYGGVPMAKKLFDAANEILGFNITEIMFNGTAEQLKQTAVTQPAVFLHSTILALSMGIEPNGVAGHSLGEFSALVAAGTLSFEDGLQLVSKRAAAMQRACELAEGTMAAVLAMPDDVVEQVCRNQSGVVVAANYNCPGQLVISGEAAAVNEACAELKSLGARRALVLPVGGAFHSPLMEPARFELEQAIEACTFREPCCPIYQNVDALPHTSADEIKANLIAQLTAPVRWTQIVKNMVADGFDSFVEVGPGQVLKGLVSKCCSDVEVVSVDNL